LGFVVIHKGAAVKLVDEKSPYLVGTKTPDVLIVEIPLSSTGKSGSTETESRN
jgi:hypothetical protein